MFSLSNNGNTINNTNDGKTSQKTLDDKALTLEISFVSTYSQIIASTDTSGTEASTAPIRVLHFDISDIATINNVVITILSV